MSETRIMQPMIETGSAVVATLKHAAEQAVAKWRAHVRAGTAQTPEGVAAFEASKLANATLLAELGDREARARAA